MQSIQLIVFLPLLAAIIAGLGNKALGNVPAKIVTTGALFVSCALSWPIFLSYVAGHAEPSVAPGGGLAQPAAVRIVAASKVAERRRDIGPRIGLRGTQRFLNVPFSSQTPGAGQ